MPRQPGVIGLSARLLQAGVLSLLLGAQLLWLDFGASAAQAAVTISATLGAEFAATRALHRQWDPRSPLITGLSLSLLLRSHDPAVWVCAGVIGIGSKYLIRLDGRHVFNPACFAIVAMLLSGRAWISPGQWGTLALSGLLLGGLGSLVLQRAGRIDVAIGFLTTYAGLLVARCLRLGDPWAIPLHQVQSGSLLIFSLFMITDPRTTPASRVGRLVFAAAVALAGFSLQFGWQVREGLFYALFLLAPLARGLDRLLLPNRVSLAPTSTPEIAR